MMVLGLPSGMSMRAATACGICASVARGSSTTEPCGGRKRVEPPAYASPAGAVAVGALSLASASVTMRWSSPDASPHVVGRAIPLACSAGVLYASCVRTLKSSSA